MLTKLTGEKKIQISKMLVLLFLDVVLIVGSMICALWVRYDFQLSRIDPAFIDSVYRYVPINVCITLLLFQAFHFYNSLCEFAILLEIRNVIIAVVLSTILQLLGMCWLGWEVPGSYPLLYLIMLFLSTSGIRFVYRAYSKKKAVKAPEKQGEAICTMIVGAGETGRMLVNEIKGSPNVKRSIACIVDDESAKVGTFLQGVPIVGDTSTIPYFAEKYHVKEIIITIPLVSSSAKKKLLEICQMTNCRIMLLPDIYQIINGETDLPVFPQIEINDFLGRPPVKLSMEKIMDYVKDKVILVTGGGGSIGSEICRQLALHKPKQLIIFDIYENNAYDIQNELLKKYPELNLEVLIGSVRNQKRVDTIFETYSPDLVFHAAAHKHVPLMEDSPNEAIKNNVLGTWIVAHAADQYGAQKMVLISTDKAVRPTNIMGASKRICELIIQSFAQTSQTEFAAVRFGNVLGSNGSVVPLFKKQIAEGGPVTVTDPDVIRYFMTIPEAVNLVLQCGALAKGGEIFILDMGEPVKILDLATKMIRLSGLEPGKDIKIEFTGLRPGEKLYEELLISLDHLKKTENERIFVAQQPEVDEQWIQQSVQRLVQNAFDESMDIREMVKELVPEYTPKENKGEQVTAG